MYAAGNFEASRGSSLYCCSWNVADAGYNVIIVHGYREHCNRYASVAAFLNDGGYNVYSYDQRWHGHSPGKRGYIERFDTLIDDLDAYIKHLEPELGDRPTFVVAHSMGGLVFTRFLESRIWRPRAAVFSGPFLQVEKVSPVLLALAGFLSAWLPWVPVASLDSKAVSRDAAVVKDYEEDPLNGTGPIVARAGAEISAAVERARSEMKKIDLPVYILHGGEDRLAPPAASQYLYDHISSRDKTLRIYENGYHESFNDLDRDQVLREMRDWLDAHR
ncbi:MAG: alpha/beta fold hydrolase [Candidatus Hydrogenedens sp.]|nr:alpha/beta fold hydrolase [Candidatus Hydrogenedens sp.]